MPEDAQLPTYRPLPGRYDELADERGRPREQWAELVDVFARLGPAEIDLRRRQADRLVVGEGAGYVVQDDEDSAPPWRVDPVPLVWPPSDWAAIAAGVAQRAALLDAIARDLYGEQRLLREGVLPAELALGSPTFCWSAVGAGPVTGPGLVVHAADVVRDATGRLLVLRDHTDAPSGAGYSLVNRRVLTQLFPDVYRKLRVERLGGFFADLRHALAWLAPSHRSSPRTVVLAPGITHPGYFEHSYLASYLGYHLVEGADLAVRGGRVWLRALGGLEPVDVVLRRVDDAGLDPLELGGGTGGVPGLLQASREGQLGIANAIGTGAVADVALQAYLPAACQALLGEPLRLPSLPTLWLGEPEQRAEALATLDRLVLHRRGRDGVSSVIVEQLDQPQRAAWLAAIEARPERFAAQPVVALASAPVLRDQAVVPGTVVVRVHTVAGRSGWTVLPGGLGRVVHDGAPQLSHEGGPAKDVWVLSAERGARPWSALVPAVPQVDLRTSMPSRAAEALFWVGRNAERAEATARLALVVLTRSEHSPELVEPRADGWWDRAAGGLRSLSGGGRLDVDQATAAGEATGAGAAVRPAPLSVRDELAGALGDRPSGLADSLSHLAGSAGSVREYLSSGTWRVVGSLDARRVGLAAEAAKADLFQVADSLQDVVLALMALAGLTAESIVRGPGWRFLDLGRRLERALCLLNLVETVLVPPTDPGAFPAVLETVLTASESLVAYRRRYRSDLELEPLCELLLADDTNPRSLAFQLDRMGEDMASLPERRELHHQRQGLADAAAIVLAEPWRDAGREAAAGLGGAHRGLQQLVLDVRGRLLALHQALVETWFAHVGEARVLRRRDG